MLNIGSIDTNSLLEKFFKIPGLGDVNVQDVDEWFLTDDPEFNMNDDEIAQIGASWLQQYTIFRRNWGTRRKKSLLILLITSLKPAADDSRKVREIWKTCETRVYGLFCVVYAASWEDFSHLKLSRGRSGNYAWDKGIFSCNKG